MYWYNAAVGWLSGHTPTTLHYLYSKTYGGRIDVGGGTITAGPGLGEYYTYTYCWQVLQWFYVFFYTTVCSTVDYKVLNVADGKADTPWVAPLRSNSYPNVTFTLSGTLSTIGSVKIYASTGGATGYVTGNSANSIEIHGSTNGTTFTPIAYGENLDYGAGGTGSSNTLTINAGSTQYKAFRLVVKSTKNVTPSLANTYLNLPQIEFYEAGATAYGDQPRYVTFRANANLSSTSTIVDPINIYVLELSK
jgi:hypothetical protein